MGSCIKSKHESDVSRHAIYLDSGKSFSKLGSIALQEKEVNCLKLLYKDLSLRSKEKLLDIRTFTLFFHLNSAFTVPFFEKFRHSLPNFITEEEFIVTFDAFNKENKKERVQFVIECFQDNQKTGLTYSEIMGIFLSFPFESTKQILTHSQFLNSLTFGEVCELLLESRKEHFAKNVCSIHPSRKYQEFDEQSHNEDGERRFSESKDILEITEEELTCKSKLNLWKLFRKNKCCSVSLIIKFVKWIFEKNHLSKEKDEIEIRLLMKTLGNDIDIFSTFFEGFHEYLWKVESEFPVFKTLRPLISDPCTEVCGNEERKVYLALIKTSLMIFEDEKMKEPIDIRNIEGLHIREIESELGFGFVLYENEGIYPEASFYFENESQQTEWIELLKEFVEDSFSMRYKIKSRLSKGRNSQVCVAIDLVNNEHYAVKILRKPQRQTNKLSIHYESEMISLCSHENVVKIIDRFETGKDIYLVMELESGGNLEECLEREDMKIFKEEETKTIMKQLFMGLKRIHSLGIVHRDITLENILMKKEKEKFFPKISDFGHSIFLSHLSKINDESKYFGSEPFLAPELRTKSDYNEKIDVYNLGVIMFCLLSGEAPQIRYDKPVLDFSEFEWQKISYKAKELLKLLLCEKDDRISCSEALNHRWFN